jgi:hypothetical protein
MRVGRSCAGPVRSAVLEVVRESPGISSAEIMRRAVTGREATQRALDNARRAGDVVVVQRHPVALYACADVLADMGRAGDWHAGLWGRG